MTKPTIPGAAGMSDEAFFQAALDADSADSAVRLLFAEWLAERGDWRAKGVRWMALSARAPTLSLPTWRWYAASGPVTQHNDLHFVSLDEDAERRLMASAGGRVTFKAVFFHTRQAAEEALCRALAASPQPAAGG